MQSMLSILRRSVSYDAQIKDILVWTATIYHAVFCILITRYSVWNSRITDRALCVL